MSDTLRDAILVSQNGTVTVSHEQDTERVYLTVDDDYSKTELCLTLVQHEQLIEALRQALPPTHKQAEAIALVREAYLHWQTIGWPEDKATIEKLKLAIALLESK